MGWCNAFYKYCAALPLVVYSIMFSTNIARLCRWWCIRLCFLQILCGSAAGDVFDYVFYKYYAALPLVVYPFDRLIISLY